jgi:hypothetical protein
VDHLVELYRRMMPTGCADEFLWEAMRVFGIGYELSEQDASKVPLSGGVIAEANHSFIGAAGWVLLAALRRLRPDVRVLINYVPRYLMELGELFIGLDHSPCAAREAIRWVRNGGVLLVSSCDQMRTREDDQVWGSSVARLIRCSNVPVLPTFVQFMGNGQLSVRMDDLLPSGVFGANEKDRGVITKQSLRSVVERLAAINRKDTDMILGRRLSGM